VLLLFLVAIPTAALACASVFVFLGRTRHCPRCGAPQTFVQPFSDGSVTRECDRCGTSREERAARR
jgi:rubredoxin